MKIGIGGGLGPFRAGISTRGAGVGFGPFSAGGGWRRGRSEPSDIAGTIRFGIGYAFLFWPAMLQWYNLEWAWLAAVGLGVLLWKIGDWDQRRTAVTATAAAQRVALLQRYKLSIVNAKRVLARIETNPEGTLDKRLPPSERLTGAFTKVSLIEPRVVGPGGPKVQRAVDVGDVLVSSRGLSYQSPTKHKEWLWSQMSDMTVDKGRLMFVMKNRSTISGLEEPTVKGVALYGAAVWGRGLAAGTPVALTVINLSAAIDVLEKGLHELTGPPTEVVATP